MSEKEIMEFFKMFRKCDKDKDDLIDVHEFFKNLKFDYSEFNGRLFRAFDVSQEDQGDEAADVGELDFFEFILSVYNFCTLTSDGIVEMSFKLYDTDGGATLGRDELTDMVRMVYGDKKDLNRKVEGIMRKLDLSGDGRIGLAEFRKAEQKCALLFEPAFSMQDRLMKRFHTKAWWKIQKKKRQSVVDARQTVFDLYYIDGRHRENRESKVGRGQNVSSAKIAPQNATDSDGNSMWKSAVDKESGRTYWYHKQTKETTWVQPNS